jgi:hypothetical protein
MLNVVMLNVVMLNVVMLNVIMLNVVAPKESNRKKKKSIIGCYDVITRMTKKRF